MKQIKTWWRKTKYKHLQKKYTKEDKKYDYQGIAIEVLENNKLEVDLLVGKIMKHRKLEVIPMGDIVCVVWINGYEIPSDKVNKYLEDRYSEEESSLNFERNSPEYWDLHEDDMKDIFNERYGKD